MNTNLTALHSPIGFIGIFTFFHDLIFGASAAKVAATTTLALQVHASSAAFLNSLPYYLINIFSKYVVFAFLFSLAMIVVIVIYARKYSFVRERVMSKILPADGVKESSSPDEAITNPKWKIVLDHIASSDADKWKLAIIEADIILNDLLDSLNLPGDTIGDKLKAASPADFKDIQKAWEAHKIRNAIAHEGSDFLLNQREAKRVINLYQEVFEEFEII